MRTRTPIAPLWAKVIRRNARQKSRNLRAGGLNHVGKNAFRLAKVKQPNYAKHSGQSDRDKKAWPIKVGIAAEERPAEPVDDTNHRIERIKEKQRLAKLRAYDRRAVGNRTNIESELYD